METQKIRKINVPYLLAYIFAPAAVVFLCFWLSVVCLPEGSLGLILAIASTFLSFFWWILGGKLIYKQQKKKLEQQLDQSGFVRNHTFNGNGCTVVVDAAHGNIALLFFWNPFQPQIFPASRITKTWVDDGRSGKGFMEGSSQVSFLFTVDGVKIRVYTFTSNKRWRMDSSYILTGISKADVMVKVLETARHKGD